MPIAVTMPALSPTMEEGTLARWAKQEGDAVGPGDVIAEIETDKATMEVEAVDEGVLGRIVVPEGSEGVKVNAVIAWLLEEGEDASALPADDSGAPVPGGGPEAAPEVRAPETAAAPAAAEASVAAPPPAEAPAAREPAGESGRVAASPLARRMASVPVNQLAMQKLVINQAIEATGLMNTQRLATIFDGITRHSPEGVNFKKRAEEVGWKQAVQERDAGTFDWTEDRPIEGSD